MLKARCVRVGIPEISAPLLGLLEVAANREVMPPPYSPKSSSALLCAILSLSAVLTGIWFKKPRAWVIDA
jgi:hypothetical protein